MRYRTVTFLFSLLFIHLTSVPQETAELTPQQLEEYTEQSKQIIYFLEGTLNFLGDDTQLPSDKDVIINESYLKFFRDNEVQIEDDLDENREIPLSKDVQAYLKDVDFFFNSATFTFHIEKVEQLVNQNGQLYFKVTMNRHLQGVTIENDTVDNNMVRYAEINLDPLQKDLKIVSLYTTKLNERQELRYWWDQMAVTWKNFFGESVLVFDTLPFHKIVSFDDSAIVVEKWVNTIQVDTFLVQNNDTINYGAVAEHLATDNIFTVTDTISEIEPDTIHVDASPIYKQLMRFKEIESIDISNNMMIGNLDPLSELTELTSINFSSTLIDDLSPLRNLNQLQTLNCSGTPVTDINPLRYTNNLKELNCSTTGISDYAVLQYLNQLEKLDLSFTPIATLNMLAGLNKLKQLKLSGTSINDVSPIGQLAQLSYLNLANSEISSMETVGELTGLKNLNIDSTEVSDLSPLSKLINLSVLQANHTPINDLSSLIDMAELDIIYCDASGVSRTEAEEFMMANENCLVIFNSEKLFEWWQSLSDDWKGIVSQDMQISQPITKEELHRMINRASLEITKAEIRSLEPLAMIYRLEELDASNTQVADLAPLSSLNHLRKLNLNITAVASIEPLINLDNIRILQIENTGVSDLMPLQNCSQLEIVYCDESNVSTENVLKFKKVLPECLVVYQSDNLNLWWTNLNDEWQTLLTEASEIDEKINRENLQRIVDMTKLEVTDQLSINKLEPLTVFLQLKELIIRNTTVTDIAPITQLPNLTSLEVSSSPIASVERITGLKLLKHLSIENTPIEDIEPVYQLGSLSSLNISGTQVKKLKGLESLQNLEVLSINNTNIKNLKPVEALRNLKEFRCFNTSVKASKIREYEAAHPGVEVVYY